MLFRVTSILVAAFLVWLAVTAIVYFRQSHVSALNQAIFFGLFILLFSIFLVGPLKKLPGLLKN
jgi:hypothetical protein